MSCGGLQNGRRPAHLFSGAAQPCNSLRIVRMSVSGPLVELPFYQQLPSFRSSSTDIDDPGRESVKEGKSSSVRMAGRCSRVEMPIFTTETTLARHNLTCLDDVCFIIRNPSAIIRSDVRNKTYHSFKGIIKIALTRNQRGSGDLFGDERKKSRRYRTTCQVQRSGRLPREHAAKWWGKPRLRIWGPSAQSNDRQDGSCDLQHLAPCQKPPSPRIRSEQIRVTESFATAIQRPS